MLRELKGDSAVREYMALAGKGSDFGLYSDEVAVVRGQLEARFTAGGVIDWASIDLARFTGNPALLTPGSAVLSPGTKPRFESRRGKVIKIFEELKAGSILIPVPGEDASLQIADGVTMTQLADALQNDPQKIALFFENWNSAHRGLGDVMTQLAALLPKPVADACEPADFMHAFREGRKAGKDLAAIAYDLEMQTGIEPTLKLLTAAGLYIPPATD